MAIAIEQYREDLIPAVKSFNSRLTSGGAPAEFRFPEHHIPKWLPKINGRKLYQEYFVALDQAAVRGGYILKYQEFAICGTVKRIGYYHLPLSEGIVNKAYASIGVHMLRHALKSEPLLFALGMGGMDHPLPRMLKAMGWNMCAVPFYLKVNQPYRFLKNIAVLRRTPLRRLAMDMAAVTGTGWGAITVLQGIRAKRTVTTSAALVPEFEAW
jgi:hypothetical protein